MFVKKLRQLFLSQKGAAVILIAALLPVIIGFAGIGVDTGMLYLAHSRLQTAVDAAAMAGSLELPYDLNVSNDGPVERAVREYLNVNYPEAELDSITPGTEERSVVIKGKVLYIPFFMGFFGIGDSLLTAEAAAGYNNLEVVFVIDNSSSMKGAPIATTKKAIRELVDLIMPSGMETSVKVGLVPFHGMVRVPRGVDRFEAGCRNADGSYNSGTVRLELGQEPFRSSPNFDLLRFNQMRKENYCDDAPALQELTEDRGTILATNDKQTALKGAGTLISEGVKWGRYLLDPNPPSTSAAAAEDMRKVMIILTDGGNTTPCFEVIEKNNQNKPLKIKKCKKCPLGSFVTNGWTNAYFGMLDVDRLCTRLDQQTRDEAQRAKDAGVEIFVIRYGTSGDDAKRLLMDLASSKAGTDDHYFDAPTTQKLEDVFRLIGRQLGWRLL